MDRAVGGWAELHCHSAFSLLDGACLPEELAKQAAALSYSALALTDHDSLAGIIRHAHACRAQGIRPIAGLEITLSDAGHLTLLARDGIGYRSLCRLVSTAHLAGEKGAPLATMDDLAANATGLECLTGCRQGRVSAALLRGDEHAADQALDDLRAVFGKAHSWIEVQPAGLPDDRRLTFGLARLASRAGIDLVATGNAHYARANDRDLQDVLVSIKRRLPVAAARPYLRSGASWHLRSREETARRFVELPGAVRGTVAVTERCGFALDHVDTRFPAFPVPPGETADRYLSRLVLQGAEERYGREGAAADGVQDRLRHELNTIAQLGMADYFLVVWDIVQFARGQGILCQGRGSSVGSAVAYCLGITAVEPIHHHLSFERFLSIGRSDPPDIDIDLPADRPGLPPAREAVIQYVYRRWPGQSALVANNVTFQKRSAIREVGMALGLAPEQIDALANEPERSGVGRPSQNAGLPPGPMLVRFTQLCARLQGLPRHLSQHPGGMVVTARPIGEVAPLERARMPGRVIIQWDKESMEKGGLAKIDLLGLGMLGAIDSCLHLIAATTGRTLPLHGFRCEDPKVHDLLCASDTVGVFQAESRAQMTACLPHLQPRTLDDIAIAVALIRPGPIQAGAVHPLLNRRRGLEPVTYPGGAPGRRLLEPILGETYGVCLFQDQVVELGIAAGLDPHEAADLRRAMSSARGSARMDALRERLDAGLAARGLDAPGREVVMTMMTAYSGYGFVRGHACAFGYLVYVSAWLKIYYPAAFYAALLNFQPMGFYSTEVLIQDAARHGVGVLSVDVLISGVDSVPEGTGIRLGLRLVRGLGVEAATRIMIAMGTDSPPVSLDDLCLQAGLTEEDTRALARAGALRAFIPTRRQAMWEAPLLARTVRAKWMPEVRAAIDPPAVLPTATAWEEFALDHRSLGLSPGTHMLTPLRDILPARLSPRLADLDRLSHGTLIEVAVQSLSYQRPPTAKGTTFIAVSDESGLGNVVVPLSVYDRDRTTIRGEVLLWVQGIVERRGTATTIRARAVRPLAALLTGSEQREVRKKRPQPTEPPRPG